MPFWCTSCDAFEHTNQYVNPIAGEVNPHNVCKQSRFLDTGFKQTGPAPLLHLIPMG